MVEKSAPWMNGTARAKARKESVGKPGRFVDASSPAAFTVMRATGKTSGGMTLAGWRVVLTTERRAIAPTCDQLVTGDLSEGSRAQASASA
jgi:hypothetical protein